MKKNKSLILAIVFIGIVLIVGGIFIITLPNKTEEKKENNNEEKNKPLEIADYSNLDESTANWREILSKRAIELSKELYQTDDLVPMNKETELFVSLTTFEQNNLDISKFRAEGITCNYETTGINFVKQDSKIFRVPFLDCTTSNEQE